MPLAPPSAFSLPFLSPSVWFGWLSCRGMPGAALCGLRGGRGKREEGLDPTGWKQISLLCRPRGKNSRVRTCSLHTCYFLEKLSDSSFIPTQASHLISGGADSGNLSLPHQDSSRKGEGLSCSSHTQNKGMRMCMCVHRGLTQTECLWAVSRNKPIVCIRHITP